MFHLGGWWKSETASSQRVNSVYIYNTPADLFGLVLEEGSAKIRYL